MSAAQTAADNLAAMIERLGIVQIDTISVVARSQYLVLWSRLGAYPQRLLEEALYPRRDIFEYWSHAASILPMRDYPYYRGEMRRSVEGEPTGWHGQWVREHADVLRETLAAIRARGPLASADFENPTDARRMERWEWYGPKESRRALDILWLRGDLMVHSRRAGQKVFDLRERVLAEANGKAPSSDRKLPSAHQRIDHFVRRTTSALGVLTPSWLWDYYRLGERDASAHTHATGNGRRARAVSLLDTLAREGALIPARIEGLEEPAYLAAERLPDLERLRAGAAPTRTTLLSPFDSLIWDRSRARGLFGYEVCFEAYVVPEKRRYGYYCLAILHRGRLVGRLDPKFERRERRLIVRALHLEPGVTSDADLLDGLAGALRELAAFLGAETVSVERADPAEAAPLLAERVA
ncbi:MAG: YcaQ family DNA glycosylase [Chloroflexota bacterium]|nr:YcaQ family DNA glycosylase [Chloroflexota bacterium]